MAHTPGPWELATSNSWRRFVTRDGGMREVCVPVKQPDGHPDLHFQNPDDAPLIAAAPELLAGLREAADQLQGWVNWKCPKKHVAEHQRYIEGLRALIAKAEGRSA